MIRCTITCEIYNRCSSRDTMYFNSQRKKKKKKSYLSKKLRKLILQMLQAGTPFSHPFRATEKVIRQSLVAVHVNAEVHTHASHFRQYCI